MTTAQVLQPTPTHALPASTKPTGLQRVTSTLASWLHAHAHNSQRDVPPSSGSSSSTTSNISTSSTDKLLNHTAHICTRCNRPFILHINRPSGLFYRDKCNYYYPGRLVSPREILDRCKGNKVKQQELRAKLKLDLDDGFSLQGQLWSCCLKKDDGRPHHYGGCSFNGNKHVVDF